MNEQQVTIDEVIEALTLPKDIFINADSCGFAQKRSKAIVERIKQHGIAVISKTEIAESQEAVAWRWDRKLSLHEYGYEPFKDFCPKTATSITPLYATPPPSQDVQALIAEIKKLNYTASNDSPNAKIVKAILDEWEGAK